MLRVHMGLNHGSRLEMLLPWQKADLNMYYCSVTTCGITACITHSCFTACCLSLAGVTTHTIRLCSPDAYFGSEYEVVSRTSCN